MPVSLSAQALRAVACAAALLCAPASQASTLSFDFRFTNALNGGGVVTGVVKGLREGTGSATSVRVLTNTAGYGVGEYIGNPTVNSWTVSSGALTAFNFISFGSLNLAPAVSGSSLALDSSTFFGVSDRAGLSSSPDSVNSYLRGLTEQDVGLTFTPRPATAAIPLPAAGWLLLGGLGALAGLGAARRKRAAA